MRAARARVHWVLVLVCVSRLAAADPRRILLDPGPHTSLSRKVRAEASQAGLTLFLLEPRSIAGDDDAVQVLAREPDAAAVVTLLTDRKVGIYLPSPPGAKFEILSASPADEGTFPLRIVEHLRARIAALPTASTAGPSTRAEESPLANETKPPESSDAPTERSAVVTASPVETERSEPIRSGVVSYALNDERGFWLEGGGAYGARPGGFESGWRAAIGARYGFDSLSLGAVALLPLTTSEFHEGTSSARAESWSFLVKGAVHDHPDGNLGVSGGPGIGLVVQHLQGAAAAPLESRDDTLASAALFAHGDVSWALAPWLRVALAVQAGAIVPRIAVRFEGREVTGTGTWFADALLVARLRLAPSGGQR